MYSSGRNARVYLVLLFLIIVKPRDVTQCAIRPSIDILVLFDNFMRRKSIFG